MIEPGKTKVASKSMTDDILHQQIAYYRARASEYDEWFYRVGRYDHGPELNEQWFREAQTVRELLYTLGPVESVLELACGTGIWTQELVKIGQQITAIDASAEVIGLARQKMPTANISFQQADLFSWEPARQYDLVFFGFWLSHVPPEKLDPFLGKVACALKPGGKVFLVDSRPTELAGAKDKIPYSPDGIYHTRKLKDGQTFKIVKIFYEPADLAQMFARHRIRLTARTTYFFLYAGGEYPG
jgi:2-polyprenyl-3-methyl-5-hydroxy-6-metoxy-1,4-benzoquinol methylase